MLSRRLVTALGLVVVVLGSCSVAPSRGDRPDPRDRVPIAPPIPQAEDEHSDDPKAAPIDWKLMEKQLAERFSGLETVDFMRILISSEKRTGPCWTTVPPPWETRLDVDYAIDGERASASGYQALKEQGWWPIYRSPEGIGIEQRASFTGLDVTLGTGITCQCSIEEAVAKGDSKDLELRFRWAKGKMPEVSAIESGARRSRVLSPSITYGHLLTYEFEVEGSFPQRRTGRCGARVTLAVLAEPPIL